MSDAIDLNDVITTKEAAAICRLKTNTFEIYRHQGKGPPFLKLGDTQQSPVRYLRSEVVAWFAQQTFKSTSAHSAAVMAKRTFTAKPGAIPGPWEGTARTSSQPGSASK